MGKNHFSSNSVCLGGHAFRVPFLLLLVVEAGVGGAGQGGEGHGPEQDAACKLTK